METGPIILLVQGTGRDRLMNTLEENGFDVDRARNGKQAVAQIKERPPVLAVIDPSSLRIGGPRLCQRIKRTIKTLPILWILDESETNTDEDMAERFLRRPFSTSELLDDISEMLPETEPSVLYTGNLIFDVKRREVRKGKNTRRLTPKQAKLLETMMRQPDQVLSRRFLMKHVWKTDYLGDTRTLDVHIRWIREAIEDEPSNPKYIHTVRGVGYRFDSAPIENQDLTT